MNWAFWLASTALVLLALAFVLPPLVWRRSGTETGQSETNRAVLRRRLRELQAEREQGELGEAEYAEARADIERQALEQVPLQEAPARQPRRRWGAAAVLLLVPVLTAGVYWQLGGFRTMQLQQELAQVQATRESQVAFIREHLDELERRVRANPAEGEGWLMLGRSYMVLERYAEAAQAFGQARERLGDEPELLLSQAEAAAYAGGEQAMRQAAELTETVLERAPRHPRALWFAGMLAAETGRTEQAIGYWQRLRAQLPAEGPARAEVDRLLAQIGAGQGQPAPEAAPEARIAVSVQLDPALASELPPETPVFIFAKAVDGPAAPLAVQRRTLGELPLEVTLSSADAMVPGMSLGRYPQVRIEARVSRGGTPQAQSGDLEGVSAPLDVRRQEAVSVTIDRIRP